MKTLTKYQILLDLIHKSPNHLWKVSEKYLTYKTDNLTIQLSEIEDGNIKIYTAIKGVSLHLTLCEDYKELGLIKMRMRELRVMQPLFLELKSEVDKF